MSGFHGWSWLTFLALVAVAGLLVTRRLLAGQVTLPELPASDPVLYMGGGALEVAGALLYWVEYHGSYTSMRFGWYLTLLAGVATIAGGYLTTRNPQLGAETPLAAPRPGAAVTAGRRRPTAPPPPRRPTPAPAR